MFGFLIQRNYSQALEFDKTNNNSKWYDAIKAEMDSIHSFQQEGSNSILSKAQIILVL